MLNPVTPNMSSSIILPSNFSIDNLSFGSVKTLDNGGKVVYMSYNGKPLIVQTPEMIAPYGMSRWNADGGPSDNDKFTLEMSFRDKESRPSLQKFHEMLTEVDKKMIDEGMNNSQAWFKKKYSTPEVVEALYTPLVKYPKDKNTGEITDKYPPTFRLSLPMRDGKFTCNAYDNNKEKINLNDVEMKGAKVTAIIQCTGVWLAGGKFGCSWRVLQVRVVPPSTIKGFAFQDIEEDKLVDSDIDDEDAPARPVASRGVTNVVSDSDEEEDLKDDEPSSAPPANLPKVTVETSDDEDEIEKPKKKSVVLRKKTAAK